MSARGSIDTLSPRALSPSRANGFAPVDSLQEPLLPQQEAAAPGDGKRGRLVAELRKCEGETFKGLGCRGGVQTARLSRHVQTSCICVAVAVSRVFARQSRGQAVFQFLC